MGKKSGEVRVGSAGRREHARGPGPGAREQGDLPPCRSSALNPGGAAAPRRRCAFAKSPCQLETHFCPVRFGFHVRFGWSNRSSPSPFWRGDVQDKEGGTCPAFHPRAPGGSLAVSAFFGLSTRHPASGSRLHIALVLVVSAQIFAFYKDTAWTSLGLRGPCRSITIPLRPHQN